MNVVHQQWVKNQLDVCNDNSDCKLQNYIQQNAYITSKFVSFSISTKR